MCVALAEGGVVGATASIEGKNGFLKAYSPNQNKDLARLAKGLGHDWVWLDSALKPYAACRMTHSLIELAGHVHTHFESLHKRPLNPNDIREVTLWIPASNFILVDDPTPNKIHPENVVDAQFSAYFQVANALLFPSHTGLQFYQRLKNEDINALAAKTRVVADEHAVRDFPGRMRITWANGVEEERFQEFALGEQQHPFLKTSVHEKYLSLAVPTYGEGGARMLLQTIDTLEVSSVRGLVEALR